ncbi:MAG: hypothetical protein ACI9KE_003752 [Polyangiales bacterium]|jgi:hypothetical protein
MVKRSFALSFSRENLHSRLRCARSFSMKRALSIAFLFSFACGDDDLVFDVDAGPDAAREDTGASDTGPVGTDAAADSGPDATDAGPPPDDLRPDCEPLVPEYCSLPFPSNYWLAEDSSTVTGHRLAVGATSIPRSGRGISTYIDPAPINERDGFSLSGTLLAYLPGATATGLPSPLQIADSLLAESPSVIIHADTGERIAHWSEIDEAVADPSSERAFMIRSAAPFEPNARYIVALRSVVDAEGNTLPPSATFAALRDNVPSDVPTIEPRRAHFEELFATLDDAGVVREDLQLAWDFTTGSVENDTAWLLSARDQALEAVGADGPDYEIESIVDFTVEENVNIRRRIEGQMIVPLYLTDPGPGGLLNLDDGVPQQNGTARYPFIVNIPHSATGADPAPPIVYGHGQLGSREESNTRYLAEAANANNFIVIGVDWIGFASDDIPLVAGLLSSGELSRFRAVPERQIQGIVNFMLAIRMMRGSFSLDDAVDFGEGSVIKDDESYYIGASQGGIFGGTLMSVFTDVTRGVLAVPGQPYTLLLSRSVNFDTYSPLLRTTIADGPAIQIALSYVQLLWDRSEPGSYTSHIAQDLFPGTPAHNVLMLAAVGDQQVTTLGAHTMARAVGASLLGPAVRSVWGLEEVSGPFEGSALLEFDYGNTEPVQNIPPRDGDDPHGALNDRPDALNAAARFLRTGIIENPCDGACDPD